jgi:hypothetical protein
MRDIEKCNKINVVGLEILKILVPLKKFLGEIFFNGFLAVSKNYFYFFVLSDFCTSQDNTPLFVKYNPGLLDLHVLLDETGLQTGL